MVVAMRTFGLRRWRHGANQAVRGVVDGKCQPARVRQQPTQDSKVVFATFGIGGCAIFREEGEPEVFNLPRR